MARLSDEYRALLYYLVIVIISYGMYKAFFNMREGKSKGKFYDLEV